MAMNTYVIRREISLVGTNVSLNNRLPKQGGLMKNAIRAVLLSFFMGSSLWTLADDVTDAIDDGISAYKKGAYSEAASQLEYAASLVRQKKADRKSTRLNSSHVKISYAVF